MVVTMDTVVTAVTVHENYAKMANEPFLSTGKRTSKWPLKINNTANEPVVPNFENKPEVPTNRS